MIYFLLVIIGLFIMILGANVFVEGSSNIAKHLKIPSLLIGLTIVAFGTSAPEAAVSITSTLQGHQMISIGNILGSNLFNLLMVLGFIAVISPVYATSSMLKRDMPFALLASMMVLLFYFILGKSINRVEGFILLCFFAIFLFIILNQKKNQPVLEEAPKKTLNISIVITLLGLSMIILGGVLTTNSAVNLAHHFKMTELFIGLTVVAIGTSLPELVTSVVAMYKKEKDIALGNILGSNIFNIFFILGASSLIKPVYFSNENVIDLMILLFVTVIVYVFMMTGFKIKKREGFILIFLYILFFSYILIR